MNGLNERKARDQRILMFVWRGKLGPEKREKCLFLLG
jgi:hypothetical protein